MNIWILTIGSSDVQLTTKTNWTTLFRNVRSQLDDRGFNPSDGNEGRFQVPARVLGIVYNQPEAEKYFNDLVFPLIHNFLSEIKDKSIDKIILVLGEQSIFKPTERSSQNHAYWQDTCTLQPILKKYLKQELKDSSPDLQFQPLFLEPTSTAEGLDDWNGVLKLVQDEFSLLDFPDNATIYVSHQAGTPAISSAVQFESLAKFGDRVKFLVSNERDSKLTRVLPSSSYLKGIRKQEAKKLLEHHDYSGVKKLINSYLDDEKHKETKILLEAAIQWNFAHFAEGYNLIKSNKLVKKDDRKKGFVEILSQNSYFRSPVAERTEDNKWWWAAYEAAYLSFIRLKQGNTVEAVFHSFRSVEGLLKTWTEQKYPGELINTRHPNRDRNLRLYGEDLYTFLDMKRNIDQSKDFDIWVFGNVVIKRRNDLFHNIKGLNDQENVFEAWRSSNETQWKDQSEEKWKIRVLNCLNFIVREDFPKGFKLEDASLMVRVHEELEKAIANL
jgi:hypothetical protein